MKKKAVKRKKIRREWEDAQRKVSNDGKCRGCGAALRELKALGRRLEAAHLIGREYDAKTGGRYERYVHPDSVIPLCGPATTSATCHGRFHDHKLSLWPKLTKAEQRWVIDRVGEGQARRKIEGRTPLATQIIEALRGYRFNFVTEDSLQHALEYALSNYFRVEREVPLGPRDRIDLLIGTVGIETKVGGSTTVVNRQLERYAESDRVTELILFTSCARHRNVDREINGKPVHVVYTFTPC